MELHERAAETVAEVAHLLVLEPVLEFTCEAVGLVLEAAADGVEGDADDGFEGREDHLLGVRVGERTLYEDNERKEAARRTWKSKNARMVGGCAETAFGKSNARSRGGACMNAGKSARIVKMWPCEIRSSFVGCMKNQWPSSCAEGPGVSESCSQAIV